MKAADRESNYQLFKLKKGTFCLNVLQKILTERNSSRAPTIPSRTLLESKRPNYVKYFKTSDFGECQNCKPAYDTYVLFKKHLTELNPTLSNSFPLTVSGYVTSRICKNSKGNKRHL